MLGLAVPLRSWGDHLMNNYEVEIGEKQFCCTYSTPYSILLCHLVCCEKKMGEFGFSVLWYYCILLDFIVDCGSWFIS